MARGDSPGFWRSVLRVFEPGRPGARIQLGVGLASAVLLIGFAILSRMIARGSATGTGRGLVIATAFLLFLASGGLGALAGFLFGLPRSRVVDPVTPGAAPATPAAGSTPAAGTPPPAPPVTARSAYLTNSNLIRISDWLTTIVVGLTLVNLGKIVPAVRDLGDVLAQPLGGTAQAATVGVATVIAGAVSGFLLCYMWTTLQYRSLLEDGEGSVEVPQVDDLTVGAARAQLGRAGLTPQIVPADAAAEAQVAYQSPTPGTRLPAGATVIITVNR